MSFLSTILALLPDNVSKKIKPVDIRTSFEYVYEDMENMSATFPPGENGQIYEIDNDLPEKIKPTDRLTENEMAAASALTTLSGVLEELADIEQNKANKDASEMSSANIISWQEALAINDLSDNLQDAIIALQNADIAEANARTFADGVLDTKITTEKNRNDSHDLEIATKLTKPTSPNNTSDRLLTADGGTTAKSNYQRNKQYFISLPATVSEEWKGCMVFFTSSGALTVPTGLTADFTFNGIVDSGVSLTPAITTPMTWLGTAPAAFSGIAIFTMVRRDGTNNFQILGV